MSKANALAGLIGNYGDSDEDSDDGTPSNTTPSVAANHSKNTRAIPQSPRLPSSDLAIQADTIHPPPTPHCPWSACYDETSGFTYYWNQETNEVTWDTPPEYLLALKLVQYQLSVSGTTEISAEEWQVYRHALIVKQKSLNKVIEKTGNTKPHPKNEKSAGNSSRSKPNKKRRFSEDDTEKIELITSYHNSDSESNDEADSPVKVTVAPKQPAKLRKNPVKKLKTKPVVVEYGPMLPPNQNYTAPIGPEMPVLGTEKPKPPEDNAEISVPAKEGKKSVKSADNADSQDDDSTLLMQLRDKAKLLEKLGGEIPSELQKIIDDETKSSNASPSQTLDSKIAIDNIDDLLSEIEKKELPKVKSKNIDMFDDVNTKSDHVNSAKSSPNSRDMTPPLEFKPLFPSVQNISEEPVGQFPGSVKNEETSTDNEHKQDPQITVERKETNIYLIDSNEHVDNVNRKKLRISNSVLPDRKKAETPAYTTKYSQFIEGFSSERTGLGFSKQEDESDSQKNTISYGKGLMFTKGETLNDEKKDDEDLDDLADLVEAKLKYLNQVQPCVITPVQEMLIQMQTLGSARGAGALGAGYWRRWVRGAGRALRAHERGAAPPGWTCAFLRAEGRYGYRRDADGLQQWEFPAEAATDMDICTTPPPPLDHQEEVPPPPVAATPPPPAAHTPPQPPPPPPLTWGGARVCTPPPPAWADPPPPGCDDLLPLQPQEQKKEIGDELLSFYNDIAELEKQSEPNSETNSPDYTSPLPTELLAPKEKEKIKEKEEWENVKEKDKESKASKKKPKVKISASMGLKHKTVSNLVAKWQQVADENDSD